MVLIGAGGNTQDVISFFHAKNVMIFDDNKTGSVFGNPIIGTISDLVRMQPEDDVYNCIGSAGDNQTRNRIYEKLKAADITVKPLLLCSFISQDVQIGENVFANIGSQLHHGVILEKNVVVSPGVIVCGSVHICENAFIGAGSTIIQGKTIGRNTIVGAGSVIIHDVEANTVVAGNPAKFIKYNAFADKV